jgi:tetratricopeptide (TPR) repeat protein
VRRRIPRAAAAGLVLALAPLSVAGQEQEKAQTARETYAAVAAQPEVRTKDAETARAIDAYRAGSAELRRMPETRAERDAEARRLLADAAEGQRSADTEAALHAYGALATLADAGVAGELEADYSLRLAALLHQRPELAPTEPLGALPAPEILYERAMTAGTPRQAALARNNLATLHLDRGDAGRATELLAGLDLDAVPDGERFVYRFNTGRALEAAGDPGEAYGHYLRALDEQPDFVPAAEGAWRAARAGGDPARAARRAVEIGDRLLAAGQLAPFDEVAWTAVAQEAAPDLLALLARRWSVRLPESGRPEDARWARLDAGSRGNAFSRELVLALRLAFSTARFADAASRGHETLLAVSHRLEPWRQVDGGTALAGLLVRLAEADREAGDDAAALGRTFAAWWLDPGHLEAAIACASALRARPELDPDGRIQEELTRHLFVAKGRAYQREDWRTILRLHLLLASIFEEQERWGSSHEPRSAVFQLEHALRAEEEVLALEPDFTPSPALHGRLADAYRQVGRTDAAFDHYLRAARSLATLERGEDAEAMLATAADLGLPPDAESSARLAAARDHVEEQSALYDVLGPFSDDPLYEELPATAGPLGLLVLLGLAGAALAVALAVRRLRR